MNVFLQQIVDGLSSGAIYALLALSMVLVYRATGVVNFAQGAFGTLGAYVALTLTGVGLQPLLALLAAMVLSFPISAIAERVIVRPLYSQGTLPLVIVSVGLLILITGLNELIWGPGSHAFPPLLPEFVLRFAGVSISATTLGTLVIAAVLVVALQLLFMRTRLGLAMRSVADNRESSELLGIPTGWLLMTGWGLAGVLSTVAASLLASKVLLTPNLMDAVLVYALAAIVIGGLDSPLGAVFAGLVLGVIENLAATFIPAIGNDLKILVPLALMGIVLVLRPQGLFGRREVVRV